MEKFKTIKINAVAEIEEKRSRFIGSAFYVENEEEAEKIIKDTKKNIMMRDIIVLLILLIMEVLQRGLVMMENQVEQQVLLY